jgi:3-oxoacyl-[acyl-carrier-protein] synthase-3
MPARTLSEVYITGLGAFFPGEPVANDEMEDYLGRIGGQPSALRERVLARNGIRLRHYAIDRQQRSLYRNSDMASRAVAAALARAGRAAQDVEFLAAATTQGDLLVPGFASQVHGELGGQACEIASLHGVCASGLAALRSAYLQVRAGERQCAVACASEFPSRLFKASRYERQGAGPERPLPFDTEFLRWMLSDGAGAAVLAPRPASEGLSLRVDWIELESHAHANPLCMYAGANRDPDGSTGPGWLDYASFEDAAAAGAINLKQDIAQLGDVVKLGIERLLALVQRGQLDCAAIDWVVCHYSSEYFAGRIEEALRATSLALPRERWFSNLSTRGNVGSASLFVLLEELMSQGRLREGQKLLVVIPESGHFVMGYMQLTVVGSSARPVDAPDLAGLARELGAVRADFEAQLERVPVLARLREGTLTLDDYRGILLHMRQQVVEGARWITRAASHLDARAAALRSLVIRHAADEHRDYEMLERDYVSVGGALEEIRGAEKNIGSEALSAWMFHQASQPNPLALLGALFIIEGLGARMAHRWGVAIRDQLGLRDEQVSFLLYHGGNDDGHLARLLPILQTDLIDATVARQIVKTARVTARLYALQLEEIGR